MPAPSSDEGLLLLDVTAPATPAELDRIHDQLGGFLREGGVADIDRLRFETAVVELVGNVIEHALPRPGAAVVQLRLTVTQDVQDGPTLGAVLTDDARPADVDLAPPAVADDAETGRGLALVRACCDVLGHEASATGNRWSIHSRCSS